MNSDLYATLGVSRDASADDIQQAYRERAKQAHPDAGGDPEAFRGLTTARDVLCDPVRRQAYDDTGFVPGVESIEVEAMAALLRVTAQICTQDVPPDMLRAIRTMLRRSNDEAHARKNTVITAINDIRANWKGAEAVRDRVVAGLEATEKELAYREKVYTKALEMIAEARYERKRW